MTVSDLNFDSEVVIRLTKHIKLFYAPKNLLHLNLETEANFQFKSLAVEFDRDGFVPQ